MPYLIIDLEMSGSEFGFHDIIQIGAVLADDKLNSLGEFSSLVYPKNDSVFSEEAEEIHGISIFDLEEAELIHDVLEQFENWIRQKLNRKKTDKLKHNDILLKSFESNQFLESVELKRLKKETNLSELVIKKWFLNRRYRLTKKGHGI